MFWENRFVLSQICCHSAGERLNHVHGHFVLAFVSRCCDCCIHCSMMNMSCNCAFRTQCMPLYFLKPFSIIFHSTFHTTMDHGDKRIELLGALAGCQVTISMLQMQVHELEKKIWVVVGGDDAKATSSKRSAEGISDALAYQRRKRTRHHTLDSEETLEM